MNEEIRTLVEGLRRGQYEDPSERIELLAAALREHHAELALLTTLLKAPQVSLRLAAVEACRGRTERELIEQIAALVMDPETRVRERLPRVLEASTLPAATEALLRLTQDSDSPVRKAAVGVAQMNPSLRGAQEKLLQNDPDWEVRLAAAAALGEQPDVLAVQPLLRALAQDQDADVGQKCAELIERRLATAREGTAEALPRDISLLNRAEARLKSFGGERFRNLLTWIVSKTSLEPDPAALATYGTDLTAQALRRELPRGHRLDSSCATMLELLRREKWRSIALLGQAGAGKTALVNELVYRLQEPENGHWRVLRVSPSDFMAGTRYLGEWETKVRGLIEAIRKPRRVILYVPNLGELANTGSTELSDNSVASALAPYLEDGSVLLIGETTPEEFERGLGRKPALKRLFDTVLVEEADDAQTLQILAGVRDEQSLEASDELLQRLLEHANHFLSHIVRPGNAVILLKGVAQAAKESRRPVNLRDVLDSLSRSSGVPADILDDSIPLNQSDLRQWFERRIMGQTEALEAVVDLVTLVKAGLNDPHKPFGVFLFIGPTGVGKTELAKALAEFLFGNADRLKRFDMSEFATYDGFTRLIGKPDETGLLTEAVRQHPFSVVLLDEIEKGHQNVFDLCLQLFDAGRLTDGRGRTADFRRTIIILTSNIGSAAPVASMGFHSNPSPPAVETDKDRTFRELTRFFRPEFLNRLDRIVQFRPLSLEVAERIARREIEQVLTRSGIRRRGVVVEVAPEVVALLVREGYSPHFGARPLKRTVEKLLLLPLARTLSDGGQKLKGRSLLRLVEKSGMVEVTFAPGAEKVSIEVQKADRPPSREQAVRTLVASFEQLCARVQPLANRKSELVLTTHQAGFYQDATLRAATFDELHKLDQFLALLEGLGRAVRSLEDRLRAAAPAPAEVPAIEERIAQLQAELEQLDFIACCKDAQDLGDALLALSMVDRVGDPVEAVGKLCGMYRGLAERRRMEVDVLGELWDSKQDRAWLLISGLGAFGLLKQEAGLHQLDWRRRERKHRSGKEVTREDREIIRVEVTPLEAAPDRQFNASVKTKVTLLRPVQERLLKAELSVSLFHEASLRSLELWTRGPKAEAIQRSLLILHACSKQPSASTEEPRILRHYELGISPRVKDARTHRVTTRVDRVFKGYLDHLLFQPNPSRQT